MQEVNWFKIQQIAQQFEFITLAFFQTNLIAVALAEVEKQKAPIEIYSNIWKQRSHTIAKFI